VEVTTGLTAEPPAIEFVHNC